MLEIERELKQWKFMRKHHAFIMSECYKHKDETGYLQLFVDNNFRVIHPASGFVPGEFEKGDYLAMEPEEPITHDVAKDYFWIYYTILWGDNKTKWNVKEIMTIE